MPKQQRSSGLRGDGHYDLNILPKVCIAWIGRRGFLSRHGRGVFVYHIIQQLDYQEFFTKVPIFLLQGVANSGNVCRPPVSILEPRLKGE
jgi:hypothetical protein